MRSFFGFTALIAMFFMHGCVAKSFPDESAYLQQRPIELVADAEKGHTIEEVDGARWVKWTLESGQIVLDLLTTRDGRVFIERTIPFDSDAEAMDFIKTERDKTKPSENPISEYRKKRSEELNGAQGTFIAPTPGGHLYGWTLPDGSGVLDTLVSDGRGGVTIAQSQSFTDARQMMQQLPEESPNWIDWKQKRAQSLNAQLDWGELIGPWSVFGWKLSSGEYVMDVTEYHIEGIRVHYSRRFPDLQSMVNYVQHAAKEPNTSWRPFLQYSKLGWLLVLTMIGVGAGVLFNIARAQRAKGLSIRRIAGLDQIDEAVGRATETARPVLMVPGIGALDGISVQALTIFASVVRTAVRFATPIRLLTAHAGVYGVAQEIVRDVYLSEGAPERFDPDSVRFVSDRQFAFASGVAGTIQRERVAAAFLMGEFFAESLIIAENANIVGAIQVASSTQTTQTPFFIAACDYVLLGDEFYAASAYLGRVPVLLGSLVGVDWAKMAFMAFVVIAVVWHSIQTLTPVKIENLSPEMRTQYERLNQKYIDWRTEAFFVKITREERQ
ncbi:MAG TPA: DUF6754 domain-containing protein [Fimbriimonadales bacterium]|nr:DUF6754 domain-containing protein [Fimbriimonadales bacterium]